MRRSKSCVIGVWKVAVLKLGVKALIDNKLTSLLHFHCVIQ